MKSKKNNEISKEFWNTEIGSKVCTLLHNQGWDALDLLNELNDKFPEIIKEESNTENLEKLTQASKDFQKSLTAFRKAFFSLKENGWY